MKIKQVVDKKKIIQARKSLNINDEYLSTLRTKSYAEFFTKAQLLINDQHNCSSSCDQYHKFSETLLEPVQEAIPVILDSALILSKTPKLKTLMHEYFEVSAEASTICTGLLKSINQIHWERNLIQRALNSRDSSREGIDSIISELDGTKPLSGPSEKEFKAIREKHYSVLRCLKETRNKVRKKMKLIECTVAASAVWPALLGLFPLKSLVEKLLRRSRADLRRVWNQLDVAAKGTYILNRDFDTMSSLLMRLRHALDHHRAMVRSCLEKGEFRFWSQVVNELNKSDFGLRSQLEELEEHVCLCLVTINRARALVIKEMISSASHLQHH